MKYLITNVSNSECSTLIGEAEYIPLEQLHKFLGFLKQSEKLDSGNMIWDSLALRFNEFLTQKKTTQIIENARFLQQHRGLFRNLRNREPKEVVILNRHEEITAEQNHDAEIKNWKIKPGKNSYKVFIMKTDNQKFYK